MTGSRQMANLYFLGVYDSQGNALPFSALASSARAATAITVGAALLAFAWVRFKNLSLGLCKATRKFQ